jgi:iron-sulfur cluster repair protein YtfE (RIC family)
MDTISSNFTFDHLHSGILFSSTENYVHAHNWGQAKKIFIEFVDDLEWHFTKETDVLFPLLVEHFSNALEPTQMMLMEHDDMRQIMEDMREQIDNRDAKNYLGLSETLLILMNQHNT